MHKRGIELDGTFAVAVGWLLVMFMFGGLCVRDAVKDRTGEISPIGVEFLSVSPCLYDTTPIGGTLISASGDNSMLKIGDTILYQKAYKGCLYPNGMLFPCYAEVVPTQDADGNWSAGFNLLPTSGDTVNVGFKASSNRRKTEYSLISGGNTSLDTGIYGFTLKFSGLTVGDRYVFAGQELHVSEDGSAIASVLTPCGGVGFTREGTLSQHGYHYLNLVKVLDSGTVEKEIEFSIEMAH